ncbi:superoxide dismutase, Fe-Mn family, partial [Phenoliferia sp. Uapishka_3]
MLAKTLSLSCFAVAAVSSVGAASIPSNLQRRSGNDTTYAFSLPYNTSALEPWISNQTNVLHLEIIAGATAKLHAQSAAIVKLLNEPTLNFTAINSAAVTLDSVSGAVETHIIYFNSLAPTSTGGGNYSLASTSFSTQVTKDFGSYASMISALNSQTALVPASGWGWLVWDTKVKALDTTYTVDEELLDSSLKPVLNVDIVRTPMLSSRLWLTPAATLFQWEHAYFLDTGANKTTYLSNLEHLYNWKGVSQTFANVTGNATTA